MFNYSETARFLEDSKVEKVTLQWK